ncbi:hypothetical protein Enr13x_65720 [Stieleria neptunia]|uniref:Uncharacterized protein n=1 Tax=Stieleria neptunia TaxID=2527979 RepID=A0A518I0M5_9BACT|nr:hypothetical protein [Stieleria neptunia]QDV46663.1 hypothetical protein Enr13x_65720 [Stieleria neptunia]
MNKAHRISGTKLEDRIAAETEAGRESLRVWRNIWRNMTGEQRIAKAFQLTEEVRQVMRAGIRSRNPEASEAQIQHLYVNQLLAAHGTSLEHIKHQQKEDRTR